MQHLNSLVLKGLTGLGFQAPIAPGDSFAIPVPDKRKLLALLVEAVLVRLAGDVNFDNQKLSVCHSLAYSLNCGHWLPGGYVRPHGLQHAQSQIITSSGFKS